MTDFNPAQIEQMQVEFVECDNCQDGSVTNGLWWYTCPKCNGTCEVEVKEG